MADFAAQQLIPDDLQDQGLMADFVAQQLVSDDLQDAGVLGIPAAQDFLTESVSPVDVFAMRAFNTTLVAHVYWESLDTPDLTGALSGYPPVQLTDILVYARRILT